MPANRIFTARNFLYICVIAVASWLILPILIQDGMFVDGLWYATISHNLANNIGHFWAPFFTATFDSEFYSHPPLVFILQSFFFKWLGSGIHTERIYCAVTLILTCILLTKVWNRIATQEKYVKTLAPVVLILFLLNENIFSGYPNNFLECTMGLFTLLSVYFLIISYSKFSALRFAYIALGALCIVLAFFCKGPTGLFPLAFFLILWIAKGFKSTNSMATGSITLAFVFIVSIAVLCQWNPIYNNLQEYWNLQLGASLRGDSV